jgi:hypothetical protein
MTDPKEEKKPEENSEYENFEQLAKKLFAVPYENIKKEIQEEEQKKLDEEEDGN